MKHLRAPYLAEINPDTTAEVVSVQMDILPRHVVGNTPWSEYSYKPEVSFALAHSRDFFLIKYFVAEEHTRASYHNIHDPVYRDSCVEFFLAFHDELSYYNFEFNCMGTCRAAFGTGSADRLLLSHAVIRSIKHYTVLKATTSGVCWTLTLVVPFSAFAFHPITSLEGLSCSVNFYKCGDDLPRPHFLSWNNIISNTPDFHQPLHFGKVLFTHAAPVLETYSQKELL